MSHEVKYVSVVLATIPQLHIINPLILKKKYKIAVLKDCKNIVWIICHPRFVAWSTLNITRDSFFLNSKFWLKSEDSRNVWFYLLSSVFFFSPNMNCCYEELLIREKMYPLFTSPAEHYKNPSYTLKTFFFFLQTDFVVGHCPPDFALHFIYLPFMC